MDPSKRKAWETKNKEGRNNQKKRKFGIESMKTSAWRSVQYQIQKANIHCCWESQQVRSAKTQSKMNRNQSCDWSISTKKANSPVDIWFISSPPRWDDDCVDPTNHTASVLWLKICCIWSLFPKFRHWWYSHTIDLECVSICYCKLRCSKSDQEFRAAEWMQFR